MRMFKTLTEKEKEEYRKWARENYTEGGPIPRIWHPVVQAECALINQESLELARAAVQQSGCEGRACEELPGIIIHSRSEWEEDLEKLRNWLE